MKKLFTFFILSILSASLSFSQTILFEDDFEGFTVGDYLSTSADWQTWSGGTGTSEDALISDDYNNTASGANSMKVIAGNDIIFLCGDKTTGEYQLKFWYYMPAGQGGYFNIQHAFGDNWAFSVNFMNDGTASLSYDNATTLAFSYTQDTWIPVVIDVNLETDQVILNIEAADVHTWQFSTSEGTDPDLKILDCVNFYGHSEAGLDPPYYVDDFQYIEVVAGVEHPELELSNTSFSSVDGVSNETLTLTNSGEEEMTFDALVYYPQPAKYNSVVPNTSNVSNNTNKNVVKLNSMSLKENKSIKVQLDDRDLNLTHFSGNAGNGLGWGGTDNVDVQASALFKYDNNASSGTNLKDYIGMEISNVIIFSGAVPLNSQIEIFEGRDGIINGPKDAAVATESFTVTGENTQTLVTLSNPTYVGGKDLFVGWSYTQLAGEFCLTMSDVLVPTDDANWTNIGVAWGELSEATYGNFGIIATLTGTPIHQWLTLDVTNGTIDANGGTQDITLQFDLSGMSIGNYSSTVIIKTNDDDDDESYNEIPVTLDVTVGVDEVNSGILTYPNPVSDIFSIVSDSKINYVKVTDLSGRLIQEVTPNTNSYKFNLSNLSKGVYIFDINTVNQTISRKIIVE